MNKFFVLLVIILILLPSALIFITVQSRRRIRPYYEAVESLSKHFPGELSRVSKFFENQPKFVGTFSGHRFSVTYISNKASYVTGLELVCYVASSHKLKIFMYETNPGTVLFAKRVHVGDGDFAGSYIYSNRPDEANRYFADDRKRKSIKQIRAIGWLLPTITAQAIRTYAADDRPKPILQPEMVKDTLTNMIALQVKQI